MIRTAKTWGRDALQQLVLSAAVRGADLTLRVPGLRNLFLDRLLAWLDTSWSDCEPDSEKQRNARWFAQQMNPWLHRLIDERPAAARAVLRFLATWIVEVYKRTDDQRTGLATPCTVVLEPTDRCNLSCPGCYAKSTHDGCDLSYEQMEAIIEELARMNVTLITISGGEPFLRERAERTLTRLGERFNNRGFLIYTNGTLIDEPTAERMCKVGNLFPAISVEGFEHQTDARRGKGVYEKNRQVRRLLAVHQVMTGFSATVTRENVESICQDAFIELRTAEGDLFGWFFLLQPIGRSPRPDLMVTADQRAMLRETIFRWRQERRPIFLGDFWNDGPLVGGCIAGGRYYFHIYANGDISPCVFSPVACGNIFDIINGTSPYKRLWDFVQDNPVFRAFRAEQDRVTDRARPCMLIDHPEAFRRIWQVEGCRAGKNMTEGYVDGQIAQVIDRVAGEWAARAPHLPPLPCERPQPAGEYAQQTASVC